MTDVTLLKKYLPSDLVEFAQKFEIPQDFLVETPELIEMVLKSKSIDSVEDKQNWFNLMPLMNDEQMDKLKDILDREKKKLAEIEQAYDQKKMDIKKKYLMKWQKMGYVKKVEEIHDKEQAEKDQEEQEAEQLLEMI